MCITETQSLFNSKSEQVIRIQFFFSRTKGNSGGIAALSLDTTDLSRSFPAPKFASKTPELLSAINADADNPDGEQRMSEHVVHLKAADISSQTVFDTDDPTVIVEDVLPGSGGFITQNLETFWGSEQLELDAQSATLKTVLETIIS